MIVCPDPGAWKGMILRRGSGKVKHVITKQLLVQGAVRAHEIDILKIHREANMAVMLTRCQQEREREREMSDAIRKMTTKVVSAFSGTSAQKSEGSAGDPALGFPKCCLRGPCGRARSPDDDRKLHVKADGALHKGCGQVLM